MEKSRTVRMNATVADTMRPFMPESSTMLSKTASAPALVKVRRSSTQALLRATASCDTRAMRTLALRCGAELSGCRAYNNQGNAPMELLAKMEHFTPQQKTAIKKQLIELPRLIGAHDHARNGLVTGAVTRGIDPKASWASPGKDKKEQTLSEREHSVKFAMATLGESVQDPAGAYEAVMNRPKLLKAPPDMASNALKMLCTTLRNEQLAVRTVKKNGKLLEYDAKKFQALVPVLLGILGAEETAYSLTVRPELMQVDRPQLIRDTVKSIADSVGNYVDAMWLVCQTLTPSSIKVETRPWINEELAGIFLRLRGVRVHNRPVYKKTAKSLAHHGSAARDMYLVFSEGSTAEEDRWFFTPHFDEKKLKAAKDTDVAQVFTSRTSPDQAIKVWETRSADGEWTPDPYLMIRDGKAPRGRGLLTVSQQNVRTWYNYVKEAVGAFWIEGSEGGAAEGTCFVGNLRKGDHIHLDAADGPHLHGKFKSLGDFAPSQRCGYIQTTLAARSQTIVLQAWEPVSVYLLFDEAEPVPPPVDEPPPDPKAKKGKDAPPPEEKKVDPDAEYWQKLTLGRWLPVEDPLNQLKLPELTGTPAIKKNKVLIRSFPRGRVEIPPHEGLGNPPLIFVKPTIAAECGKPAWTSGYAGTCEPFVSASGGQFLYSLEKPPEPVPEGEPAPPELRPHLEIVGEIGYAAGYTMIRPLMPEGPCTPQQTRIMIDTEDPIRVVIAWFQLPPPPEPVQVVETAPVDPKGKAKAAPKGAPAPPVQEEAPVEEVKPKVPPPPPPPPPSWVSAERWKKKEVNSPVVVKTGDGQSVTASYIYTKDFAPGPIFIKGSNDSAMVVLWQPLKDPRPHVVQRLLIRRPSLLGSGAIFAVMLKRLRIELGNARARRVLEERQDEWSYVCETGAHDEVDAWVAERKMESFGDELRGIDRARALAERAPDLLDVTGPQLTERCAVLEQSLGGKKSMVEAVTKLPELLLADARLLRRSADALWSIFDPEPTRRYGLCLPKLLLCWEQLETLFARLQAQFPVARQRLRERTSGEWIRWTDMVDKPGDVVATWLGRIVAEERSLESQDKVQLSGMHGKVRSA